MSRPIKTRRLQDEFDGGGWLPTSVETKMDSEGSLDDDFASKKQQGKFINPWLDHDMFKGKAFKVSRHAVLLISHLPGAQVHVRIQDKESSPPLPGGAGQALAAQRDQLEDDRLPAGKLDHPDMDRSPLSLLALLRSMTTCSIDRALLLPRSDRRVELPHRSWCSLPTPSELTCSKLPQSSRAARLPCPSWGHGGMQSSLSESTSSPG
eukprot:753241-Hanusia_phi.AAC.3